MKAKTLIICLLCTLLLMACQSTAESTDKAKVEEKPETAYEILKAHSLIALHGTGTTEGVLVTDPMCNHCRHAHLFLLKNPELYSTLHMVFMPRESYPGGDMAAWIAEDLADSKHLTNVLDFLFEMLHTPKARDPEGARMDILGQFLKAYNVTSDKITPEDLRVRLEKEHGAHAAEGTALARAAGLPGTPCLVLPDEMLKGFSPGRWEAALKGEE